MADIDLDWNGDEIVAALSEPFHQANEVLGREFAKEITANKWDWPGETDRKTGETVGSPRDIKDTGELLRSYAGERAGRYAHDHSWNIDYAMAVHEGARFKDGRTMPARPWTRDPIKNGKLEESFERLAQSELGNIK